MAAPRISDTGIEVKPVEITDGSGSILAGAIPSADGIGTFARSLYTLGYTLVFNGATWDRLRTPAVFRTVNLAAGTAETAIWTPAAGKKFRLMGLALTSGAACDVELHDNTAGPIILLLGLGSGPLVLNLGNGILSAAANNPLTVVRSVSTTLKGVLMGTEEA